MRTLVRWQPVRDITVVRRQLDQLFDELSHLNFETPFIKPRDLGATWIPAIELHNHDTEVVLRVELPGVDAKDLDVQVTREAVVIAGEYRSEQTDAQTLVRSEFRYGKFRRVVPLRVAVQNDQVKADFRNGVLTLTLPKVQGDRPQVVKLNLGDTQAQALPVDATPTAVDATTATAE